jgi:SpoIID/LytB domain protein
MQKLSKKLVTFASLFLVISLLTTTFSGGTSFVVNTVAEPNCDNPSSGDLDYCIQKIQQEIDALAPAHEQNKKELSSLRSQIRSLEGRISAISSQLTKIEADIEKREEDLAYAQEIFEEKASNHYKFIRFYDPLAPFLFSDDASEAFRQLNFRQKAADEDRKIMEEYAQDLYQLKVDKDNLEKSKVSLAAAKADLDSRAEFLGEEVAKVESYIATLTSKQEAFIAQKLGSLNLPATLGAGPLYCVDDRARNPGFSPAFAFYTFGIPHRVGLNQYGAYGRAKSGQSYQTILNAYFNNVTIESRPNINIEVQGYGSMPLEIYLLGVYEMPESWPLEALKAQAIAARSYALAYTDNGAKSICTSQSCQVYKQPHKSGNWKTAVEQTSGQVLAQGGQVVTAWYASTAGAYTFTSADVWGTSTGWTKRMQDTSSSAGDFSGLSSNAYDRESPCFYAAQGWRSQYDNSAWLRAEEVADIANVIMLARYSDVDKRHLYQTDKANPEGVETWSEDTVRQELSNRGGSPIASASSVSITGVDFSQGKTTQVTINGRTFTGDEFKDWFNLRAPANIQIVGPLYNVERK